MASLGKGFRVDVRKEKKKKKDPKFQRRRELIMKKWVTTCRLKRRDGFKFDVGKRATR